MMLGIVYQIVPKKEPFNAIYIGSTIGSIQVRWKNHITHYTMWINGTKSKCSIYPIIKERGGIHNFKIEVLKSYEVVDKSHLTAYEQLWINKTNCINIVNPLHGYSCKFFQLYEKRKYTQENREVINAKNRGEKGKELYQKNKDRVNKWKIDNAERDKKLKSDWHQKNKKRINAKCMENYEKNKDIRFCGCGSKINFGLTSTVNTHNKTKKHIAWMSI